MPVASFPSRGSASCNGVSRIRIFYVAIGILALGAGGVWGWHQWVFWRAYVSTDNAYVGAKVALVTPRVAGVIVWVGVEDNWRVEPRQVIVRLDPADFDVKLREAEAALALWELQVRDPVLDLRLLRRPVFALGSTFMGIFSGVMYGSLILLPIFLQEFLGYTARLAGLVTVPRALAVMVAMVITGPILSKTDARLAVIAAFACMAVSMWQIAHYNTEIDFWHVVASTLLQGFGMGMAFVALSSWALTGVEKERMGYGSALFNVIRNTGASAGIAIVSTLLVRWSQWYQGTLVGQADRFSEPARIALERLDPSLRGGAADLAQAAPVVLEHLYQLLQQQAAMLAFDQIHRNLAALMVLLTRASLSAVALCTSRSTARGGVSPGSSSAPSLH